MTEDISIKDGPNETFYIKFDKNQPWDHEYSYESIAQAALTILKGAFIMYLEDTEEGRKYVRKSRKTFSFWFAYLRWHNIYL